MTFDAAPWWVVGLVAVVFGCIGFLAIQLSATVCKTIVPFDDGPKPGRPPSVALVAGAAVIGGIIASRLGLGLSLLVPAIVVFALVAVWYSDVICGIIPDYFTLVPLALLVLLRALAHEWPTLMVTLAVAIVFGLAALFSKGRGMGWGDVKLVALGAVVLGSASLLAFAAACLAAVVIAAIRRKRSEPVAFAPYLAASIAAGMALPIFRVRGYERVILRNETRGVVVANAVREANDPFTRGIGLLLNKTVGPDEGMWIGGCSAVHTMMMRATIDLYFLDKEKRVLKIAAAVAPGKLSISCRGAKSVLELGVAPKPRDIAVGDRLVLE